MIVKDEAAVIERLLASVRGVLDSWVICDTGSTDGTQDLIRNALEGIPGELFERPWRNFGENRSELMELAAGRADYLLLLDADMTVAVDAGRLENLTADSYLLRHADVTEYWIKRLVRGDRRWHYVGVTHEYIECEGPQTEEKLDAIVIHHHADGKSWGHKFERDRALLEREFERAPGDPRTVFYLAQTYYDLGKQAGGDPALLRHAAGLYERRAGMPGWVEETYCARREAGNLHAALGDWPAAMDSFIQAWQLRPSRLEAVHDLASGLIERHRYHAAHEFTSLAAGAEPLQPPDDTLFVAPWVYQWGLLFQHSIATYWCGDYDASILACRRLLGMAALPEEYREQTKLNLEHAVKAKAHVMLNQTFAGIAL